MKAARSLTHPTSPAIVPVRAGHAPTALEVATYMPLVHQAVARFVRRVPPNVLRDDLLAAGTYGLIDSLRKNGEDRGATFEWYARVRIRGAILDELRTQDWLTRNARSKAQVANSEATGAARAAVVGFDDLSETGRAISLTDAAAESPLELTEQSLTRDAVAKAVLQLPERERTIVNMHYFHEVQFKTIASEFGVSEPRVSQLHARAMGRLRELLADQNNQAA